MNIQLIIVIILFAGAVFYVARSVRRQFAAKKGCGSNCKCGIDFSDVPLPEKTR